MESLPRLNIIFVFVLMVGVLLSNLVLGIKFENDNARIECTPDISGFHYNKFFGVLINEQVCEFENKQNTSENNIGFAMAFENKVLRGKVERLVDTTIIIPRNLTINNITSSTTTSDACEIGEGSIKKEITTDNNGTHIFVACFDDFINNGDWEVIYWNASLVIGQSWNDITSSFTHRTITEFSKPETYSIEGNFPAEHTETLRFRYLCNNPLRLCKWDAIVFRTITDSIIWALDPFGAGLQNYSLDPDDDVNTSTTTATILPLVIRAPTISMDNITDDSTVTTSLWEGSGSGGQSGGLNEEPAGNTCSGTTIVPHINWTNSQEEGFLCRGNWGENNGGILSSQLLSKGARGNFSGKTWGVEFSYLARARDDNTAIDGKKNAMSYINITDGVNDVTVLKVDCSFPSGSTSCDLGGLNTIIAWDFRLFFNESKGDELRAWYVEYNFTGGDTGTPVMTAMSDSYVELPNSPINLSNLTSSKQLKFYTQGRDTRISFDAWATAAIHNYYRNLTGGVYNSLLLESGSDYNNMSVTYSTAFDDIKPSITLNGITTNLMRNDSSNSTSIPTENATINFSFTWSLDNMLAEVRSLNINLDQTIVNVTTRECSITSLSSDARSNLQGYSNGNSTIVGNVGFNFSWYLVTVLNSSGITSETLSQNVLHNINNITNTTLAKGQNWTLSCNAIQGSSSGLWVNSTAFIIQNSPPNITSAVISPNPQPEMSDQLNASYVCVDRDSSDSCSAEFVWYQNITSLGVGTENLSSNYTVFGQNYTVSIRVFDGSNYSSWLNSSIVNVTDTIKPVINAYSVSNANPTVGDGVVVTMNCTDASALSAVANITNPNNDLSSSSMSYSAGLFVRTYTTNVQGLHLVNSSCTDIAGNTILSDTLNFTTSASVAEQTGGGGGGAPPPLLVRTNYSVIPLFDEVVVRRGSSKLEEFTITNNELEDIELVVRINQDLSSPSLADHVFFDVDGEEFSEIVINIASGQEFTSSKRFVRYNFELPNDFVVGDYVLVIGVSSEDGGLISYSADVKVVEGLFEELLFLFDRELFSFGSDGEECILNSFTGEADCREGLIPRVSITLGFVVLLGVGLLFLIGFLSVRR